MPKVLRIINRFNLGGISYNVSYLSRYMPAEFETVLTGGPEEEGEESSLYIPASMGLQPLVLPELRRSINPLSDFFAYRRVKRMIRTLKPDIVHTHASKAGAIGRLAAIHCGTPVIIHTFHGHVFHGYFGRVKTGVFKFIERYLARKSTAIIAISEAQKRELSEIHRICAPEKIRVIPLGFDLKRFTEDMAGKRARFREKYGLKEDEIAIGIIGRLAPVKNHRLFIDAVAFVLANSQRKVKAFIIGDGETKEALTAYLDEKQLGWSDGRDQRAPCVFTSWIREVDIALAGLDLVGLTSKNEGTPVSLIEAQAAGRFIITTRVGGIQDILHPACGLMSEPNDTEAYSQNLLKAVTHFDTFSAGAGTARETVLKRFSYTRLCDDMAGLYRELLAGKQSPAP
jgi:glycosyltransferase involved in cell wall biosynthesis